MRIAYVYDAVHPWVPGGIQRRVAELSTRLADDHDVHWFGLHYWDGPAVVERNGVTLHGVAPPVDLYSGDRRSIREALAFTRRLVGPLSEERFDVIDFQEFPYLPGAACKVAAARHRTPLVVTWHEVWNDYWHEYLGPLGYAGRAAERGLASLTDNHVAVSPLTQERVAKLTRTPVTLVPNGIDTGVIDDVPAADDDIDVLYAGRLIPEKNVALLLRAVDELNGPSTDLRCLVVGEGPERGRLEGLARDLNLESVVEFRDFLPDEREVYGLMKAADVFALPSRREGFGISAVEAQACGTPVVTVAEPLNAAQGLIRRGETGYVASPEPSHFAAALDAARSLSAETCMRAASEYDWDVVAAQMEAVYETVAGAPQRTARDSASSEAKQT